MERKSVSKSEQMESPAECEGLLDEGHRCGACHKVSDAKVRIVIKYIKKVKFSSRVFLYISSSVGSMRVLYLRPWGLAVGMVNAFSSNAPGPIMRFLRGSQRPAELIS